MLRRFTTRLSLLPESWRTSAPIAIASLILTNLLPLLGVLYWGWTLYSVLLLFWIESGVIGFYNFLKILSAQGGERRPKVMGAELEPGSSLYALYGVARRVGTAAFFCFHYGMFWTVHGIFVQAFFNTETPFGFLAIRSSADAPATLLTTAGMMFLSHGISFLSNFLGHDEYRHVSPQTQMMSVYGRVLVLHVMILAGGALVQRLDEPLYGVVLLVALKIAVDLNAHLREHRQFA